MKNKEMHNIKTEKENLLVSTEHRVYAKINPLRNDLTKSDFVNTLTGGWCYGSFEQIATLIDKAAARYGASSGSDKISLALLRNALYSGSPINPISDSASFCLTSNSCFEILDLNKHSPLCSLNSDSLKNRYAIFGVPKISLKFFRIIRSGAENAALIERNKYGLTEKGFVSEKNTKKVFEVMSA